MQIAKEQKFVHYVNMALGAFTRVNEKTDWREGEQIHSTLDLLFTP